MGSARRVMAGIAAIAVACGIVLGATGGTGGAAEAADMSGFRAGAIISDSVFFDEGTLSARQVQSFLAARVPSCRSGYTCLRDYRQDTFSRGADPMCRAYSGARNESAADIIAKVGQACGINPQVLIVLLQKEQGLVLSTAPTARMYRSATGYGCPDTAACDEQYYGFYNQVYKAAWAFQRYSNPAGTGPGTSYGSVFSRYAKGKTVQVLYHPDASCGSSSVYISNQATSSLYYYTPYQPDQAALKAGYGTGGRCSSYGNRNFYAYFTDWFGSSSFDVRGWIGDKYAAVGGASGVLGAATGPERPVPGGAAQEFRGGTIVSSSAGAFVVRGWIRDAWNRGGASGGPSGPPVADEQAIAGGAVQRFASGSVYSSSAGAFTVRGWIGDRYTAAGGSGGLLGFPTAEERAASGGGARQTFAGGDILSSSYGAFAVRGWIGDRYDALGRDAGLLGYPRAEEKKVSGGAYQDFQGGVLTATSSRTSLVRGWIADAYRARGSGGGVFGLATQEERTTSQGAQQQFQDGRFYASARGAFGVRGWIGDRYIRAGEQSGVLGSPVGIESPVPNGAAQRFDGGSVYSSARGAFVVRGWIGDRYASLGAASGRLGLPVGEEKASGSDVVQEFTGGRIIVGAQGVQVVYP